MKLVISGDTHGILDLDKVISYFNEHENEYTSDDYLIILGDVGVCGFVPRREEETRSILRNLPVTTLFIDGNHENFEKLNSYSFTRVSSMLVRYRVIQLSMMPEMTSLTLQ